MEHIVITDQEALALSSSGEDVIPLIVKNNVFLDIADDISLDCKRMLEEGLCSPAGMGSNTKGTAWKNESVRGDLTQWITPELCAEHRLDGLREYVRRAMRLVTVGLRGAHGLEWLVGRKSDTDYSFQYACYSPGSRYTRHIDTHTAPSSSTSSVSAASKQRRLTLIYYTNQDPRGGQLRVYGCGVAQDMVVRDIAPVKGRLVVFRSDVVLHEVLPSESTRFAITLWVSATPPLVPPSALVENRYSDSYRDCGSVDQERPGDEPAALPDLEGAQGMPRDTGTIFCAVACYRDSELANTLISMYASAAYPGRVSCGVVYQGSAEELELCLKALKGFTITASALQSGKIRLLSMSAQQASGPCWARHICQSLWQGEEYVLQIDAHMRFRGGWDRYLVGLLSMCEERDWEYERRMLRSTSAVGDSSGLSSHNYKYNKNNNKAIITTYPIGYTLPCAPRVTAQGSRCDFPTLPSDRRATLLRPTHFDAHDGMLRQKATALSESALRTLYPRARAGVCASSPIEGLWSHHGALPSPLWAAGFSFAHAQFLHDVPYSPLLPHLFHGEEPSMCARLFTHGYDCWAPREAVVYHLWERDHRPVFREAPSVDKECAKTRSLTKIRTMLSGQGGAEELVEGDRFGLGTRRTLQAFEHRVGVCFSSQTFDQGVVDMQCAIPPNLFAAASLTLGASAPNSPAVDRESTGLKAEVQKLVNAFLG